MNDPADWLGVDVGWVYPAVDSDGTIYRWSKPGERRRTAPIAGPVTITKADGTTLIRDAYTAAQLADIDARARRNEDRLVVHHVVNRIVGKARRTDRGIALEHWDTFKTRRTAWVHVYRATINLADKRGIPVRAVNRAWTSLTCPQCGFVDRANRPDRGTFLCGHCGHTGQADHVAATNLRLKALEQRHVHLDDVGRCANPACRRPDLHRSGCCLSCYFFKRRLGRYPTAEQIDALQPSETYDDFIAQNDLPGYGVHVGRWHNVARDVAKPRSKTGWTPAFARPDRPPPETWEALKARIFHGDQTCAICGHWPANELDFAATDSDFGMHNLRPVCKTHRTPLPAIAWQIRNRQYS